MIYQKILEFVSKSVKEELEKSKTPYILYNQQIIRSVIKEFRNSFPNQNYKLYYAMKANYSPKIIEFLSDKVDGVDVASNHELNIGNKYFKINQISVNGPSFSNDEIQNYLSSDYSVDINSIDQLVKIDSQTEIGIRITEFKKGIGRKSRFGINIFNDENFTVLKNKRITRIHIHFGEKDMDFLEYFNDILCQLNYLGILKNLKEINLGGGFHDLLIKEKLTSFFSQLEDLYNKFGVDSLNIQTIIEPGNAIIKYAGLLVTRPVSTFIEDNNQYISLNTSLFKNTLWHNPILITTTAKGDSLINTKISGNTCYEYDSYSKELQLPIINTTDNIVFYPMGAYVQSNYTTLHDPKFIVEKYNWCTMSES